MNLRIACQAERVRAACSQRALSALFALRLPISECKFNLRKPAAKTELGWLAIGLFGLLALCGGLWAFAAEQSHLSASGATPEERIALITSGERQVGLSSLTQRQFMIDCRNSLIMAAQLALPVDQRTALAEACRDSAEHVTAANPASSFAWFARAHSALALSDWDGVNANLAVSQTTGANEGWIARYRVELVEDNRSRIAATYLVQNRQDLAVLAGNPAYQNFLARLFVLRPTARADMTDAVEQLSVQEQRVFLAAVERARQALATGKL